MASLGEYVQKMYLAPRGTAQSALGPSLYVTSLIYAIIATLLQYVYGQVFVTLAAVEDPNPTIYTRIDSLATSEDPISDTGKKPVTSSPSNTTGYLRARGGFLSCFRGFWVFQLLTTGVFLIMLPFRLLGPIGYFLGSVIAMALLSNVQVLWVHVVISKPSTKSLWSRLPPFRRTLTRIASTVFLRTVAVQIVWRIITPIMTTIVTGPLPNSGNIYKYTLGNIGLLSLGLVVSVLIQMPAEVIFFRVAASMLSADEEPIVPFDRTFGGKVTPEILGGSGKIGIVDAWRSFSRESQVLVIKAIVWNFGIQVALLFAFGIVFVLETLII
ncbi:hypothetical protein PISL3812_06513 [Talaromyces islandicus]|uniref:Uncharacterized protein n=1 Tax=Talaromyces islandicus TaxID=28573 RepID=A0A0U1M1M8_TALIS|nr:hypothetical protein PISL3812_06513 [Talaromyces islandicus]